MIVFIAGLLVEGALGLIAVGGIFFQTRSNTKELDAVRKAAQYSANVQMQQGQKIARMEGFMEGLARAHGIPIPPPEITWPQ